MIHARKRVTREFFFVLKEHCREHQRVIQSFPDSSDEQIILFLTLGGSSEIAESHEILHYYQMGTMSFQERP
jgi:hypothetical protein